MRVLYAGVYRDQTGWGEAATRYLLALDAAGVDVVARPVRLNDARPRLPERLLELEARSSRGCDVFVQHVLPPMMENHGGFLNVGLYFSETDDIRHGGWNERLDRMDLVVGCNRQMSVSARKGFVRAPYAVLPVPWDPAGYTGKMTLLAELQRLKDQGLFVFYTIGEMVRRKNLQGLLKAFHSEFAPDEPVSLVIKADRPGMQPHETRKHLAAFCEEIKRGMKLHGGDTSRYKQEVLLTGRLSDQEILGLHAAGDVFVQPSYGEAWSIPAFDAMAMGKTPIVTDCGGYADYLRIPDDSETCGWLVPARTEPVFGVDDSLADLFTARECWWSPDPLALSRAMREAYEDEGLRTRKSAAGVKRASDFSLEKVGGQFREVLANHERTKRGREG